MIRVGNGDIFIGPTSIEIEGRAILESLCVSFDEQVAINGKFVVDALIPSARLVIQWDGDFWHGNPALYPELQHAIQQTNVRHDRQCNAYLSKCGYQVMRFWETDIHSRRSWVVSAIEAALASSDST